MRRTHRSIKTSFSRSLYDLCASVVSWVFRILPYVFRRKQGEAGECFSLLSPELFGPRALFQSSGPAAPAALTGPMVRQDALSLRCVLAPAAVLRKTWESAHRERHHGARICMILANHAAHRYHCDSPSGRCAKPCLLPRHRTPPTGPAHPVEACQIVKTLSSAERVATVRPVLFRRTGEPFPARPAMRSVRPGLYPKAGESTTQGISPSCGSRLPDERRALKQEPG